ncbi:TetR/AcrR family transcriptional regulator [Gorillibacterium sp. sgz5001074]|uniref:TetR/AcrR family transcriptional regulator n=1 Tax=Gorillibacterium sp. sgz5001074 TaxID=3446695 RepID=UPI003F673D5C
METAKPRLDPRIIRTRQLIREAFVELLEEMDIDKISVNRIAERATINRVTFYLHYKDIPDMIDKMAEEMIEEIRRALYHSPPSASKTENGEEPVILGLLEHFAEHAKFYKVILASRRTPVFTEKLKVFLTESISARFESQPPSEMGGIQKEIAIWYGTSALIGTIVSWLRADMPYTPAYLARQFRLLRSLHMGRS